MEPQPPHTGTTRTPRSSTRSLVWILTRTLVLLFLLLTVIISIAWHILDPHQPRFRVSSLSVSNFTVSDSELRGTYEVELSITNPNKKVQVMVDRFMVSVCYFSVRLSGVIVMQPIYLEKTSDKDVRVKLISRGLPTKLVHRMVSHDLVMDWDKGIVNFDVKMLARIVFEAGIWPAREKFLDIYCGNLDVGFVPIKDKGKLLGFGKDCRVRS